MSSAQLGTKLDPDQEASIVAFLHSLTGEMPQVMNPTLPPSTADTPRPQQ